MKEKIRMYLSLALVIGAIIALDIATKVQIVKNFSLGERFDMLGGFIRIALVYNEGFVFGLGQGYKNVALVISLVVLTAMVIYYFMESNRSLLFNASMALIVSGAVGNIIDRIIPGRPGVVDFISVGVDGVYRWPSFNVADSSIVVGAFLLIIVFIREEKRRKQLEAQ